MGLLKSWSFSSLIEYEKCPYRLKLKTIDGIRISPPEDPEHPLNRGNRCHSLVENYIRHGADLGECKSHEEYLQPQVDAFNAGLLDIEDEWGFDIAWTPIPWKDAACRMKLDAGLISHETYHVYDWKTGKRTGNEIKHTHQGQLYAVGALARYPSTQSISVTFRYLDTNQDVTQTYKPHQIERFKQSFNNRAIKLLTDDILRPIPNKINCKYCDFAAEHCPFAVES